ncbi:MAG: protein TolQ, partial [Pseudomonadota bacterium]
MQFINLGLLVGAVDVSSIGTTAGSNVSMIALFMQAHIVVKVVMVGLLLASIWSWAVIVEKVITFRSARRAADRFEQMFWSGQSLEDLYAAMAHQRTQAMGSMFVAAMREWKRTVEGSPKSFRGIQLRVEKVMD